MKHLCFLVMLILPLAGTGCLGLKPVQDTTRHLVLSVPAGTTPLLPAWDLPRLTVGLTPITLPGYLESPWMAVRDGDNEIQYSEVHRWGEPLEDGIRRVLALHLEQWLPASRIEARTWRPDAVRWEVFVEFQHCECFRDGRVLVAGRWRFGPPLSLETAGSGEARLELAGPPPEQDPAGAAAALSRALAGFARELAAALAAAGG